MLSIRKHGLETRATENFSAAVRTLHKARKAISFDLSFNLFPSRSLCEEHHERIVERFTRIQQHMLDSLLLASITNLFQMIGDVLQINRSHHRRVELQAVVMVFQILKQAPLPEREIQFVTGHRLHENNFVPFVAQVV